MAAALAAPYVVHSGILMPVKTILRPTMVRWLEGENNGRWYLIARLNVTDKFVINPAHYPTAMNYSNYRVRLDREWSPPQITAEMRVKAVGRYGKVAA